MILLKELHFLTCDTIRIDVIRKLIRNVCSFHDWYLVGIVANSDPYKEMTSKLQLKFNSQGHFDCVVEFEDDIYINMCFSYANRIYLSSVIIEGEYIYWVDGDEELSYESFKECDFNYISSRKLRWKFLAKEENDW